MGECGCFGASPVLIVIVIVIVIDRCENDYDYDYERKKSAKQPAIQLDAERGSRMIDWMKF